MSLAFPTIRVGVVDQPADLTISDVARLLGVTPGTVRDYADRGYLPCRRLPSGHRRFRRTDVEALLNRAPETAA